MSIVLDESFVGCYDVLTIDKQSHQIIFTGKYVKTCNLPDLWEIRVRTVLQDQFEEFIKGVGEVPILILHRS